MDPTLIGVAVVLAIVLASVVAPRLRTSAPLLLLATGMAVSLLPVTGDFVIDPEWILAGLLPPLLYSAAVSMPAMDFRRDFRAISGLSVVLVVVSSLVLGAVFVRLVPGLDYALGVALGAIVSPTDAVATSIAKRLGVSRRVVTVLEGESLFNDATALVILRSAVAATAASVGLGQVLGQFVWAVVGAVAIGWAVGEMSLRVRARIGDETLNTAISFTVPFIAYAPAEHLGASGLVAAVSAGLVAGHGAPRWLGPRHRLSERQNWRTIEVLLEGLVFLLMGLEVRALVDDVAAGRHGVVQAIEVAVAALAVALAVRMAYVVAVVLMERRRLRRVPVVRDGIDQWGTRLQDSDHPRAERIRTRLRRFSADLDFYDTARFGRREAVVLVWAGMRGAVTLAAAQTLPADTDHRSFLVLVAFFVASVSLVVQGGTLGSVVRWLGVAEHDDRNRQGEWDRLVAVMFAVGQRVVEEADLPDAERERIAVVMRRTTEDDEARDRPDASRLADLRGAVIEAQRRELLKERDDGTMPADLLARMLSILDADQIGIELRASGGQD